MNIEIAVLCRRGTDGHRRIRELHVHGFAVGVGKNGNRAKTHAFCGTDNPAGDLAAIGDQKRAEPSDARHAYILNMPKRVGAGAGALSAAAMASPSTVRVSAGSMMPSSQ